MSQDGVNMLGARTNKHTLVWRIEGLKEIPPKLVMQINPQNLDLQYSHLIQETRTLGGFIQEFWGEALTSLNSSGTTAMFYNESGVTNNKTETSGYQNFINLVNFYKNNGKVYSSKLANKIISFGTVIMTYFGKEYEGYFESFGVNETADAPFYLAYDFSFKITKVYGDLIVKDSYFAREQK
jgi:hypothetical protein